MKNLIQLSMFAFMLMMASHASAQDITKSFSGPVNGATCPSIGVQYQVSLPTGFGGCSISWNITNGKQQSQSGNTVIVVWDDTPGAIGKVEATFSNCGAGNEGNNGKTATPFQELILSVNGQSFGSYTNSINIDYCGTQSVIVTVPHMWVQGTGGIAQPPLQEVLYDWTLPAGWHSNIGTITTVNTITLYPTGCAVSGIVSVKGEIIDRCGSAGESAPATITLNGVKPVVTVGVPTGYAGSKFCNTTPVTFKANLSPSLGCVNSYSWSYPSGWSPMSQTGNTITVQPSGSSLDSDPSHPIKVSVTFTCNTTITSAGYNPVYTPPTISGPSTVCTSSSFSILNETGASVNWSSGNTNGLTVSSQANGTFAAVSGFQGSVVITAALTCGANQTSITNTVYVGLPYANNNTLIYASGSRGTNPVNLSASSTYLFICDQVPGATSFNWLLPKGFSFLSGNGSLSEYINTPATTGTYTLFCAAVNACGSSWTNNLGINITTSGGGGGAAAVVAFPNPASSSLTVQVNDSTSTSIRSSTLFQSYQIIIMDRFLRNVFSSQSNLTTLEIPVNNLPADIYYLNVFYKNSIWQKQIVIKR